MMKMYIPNTIGKLNELNRSESRKMTDILDHRDTRHLLSRLKYIPELPPPPFRSQTPCQTEGTETDDATGNMDYRFEEYRLQSFENWPLPYIRAEDLAAAGFYYTKQIDRVRCFECSTEICRWEDGDDPMVEHQRWGGRCRFIRKLPCGNVPIGADPTDIPTPRPRSRDVCGPYRLDYRLGAEADTHASSSSNCALKSNANKIFLQEQQLPSVARLGCLGIGIAKKPDFPDYASYEARLQTFAEWPTSIVQTKEQLADAGFFYTGTGDQTTCYHCGGGLKNWEPQDDPWVQHAKWFSTCFYVRLVKGQEFINNVTGKQVPPLSEEEKKKMNLPSFIKKVESPVPQKRETRELMENAPGPSNSECPSPQPRTVSEQQPQTERTPVVPATTTTSTNVNNGNCEEEQQQPKQEQEKQQQQPNEKKSIDDARVCKICYNEELGVVFLPCGHMVACVKCAPGMTTCAVCREPVSMTVRAFFS